MVDIAARLENTSHMYERCLASHCCAVAPVQRADAEVGLFTEENRRNCRTSVVVRREDRGNDRVLSTYDMDAEYALYYMCCPDRGVEGGC